MKEIILLCCALWLGSAGCAAVKPKPDEAVNATADSKQLAPALVLSDHGCSVVSIDGRRVTAAKFPTATILPMIVVEPGEHQFTLSGLDHDEVLTAAVEAGKEYVLVDSAAGVFLQEYPPPEGAEPVPDLRARIRDAANSRYSVIAVDGRPATCASFPTTRLEPKVAVEPGEHRFTLRSFAFDRLFEVTATVEPGKEYDADVGIESCFSPPMPYVRERQPEGSVCVVKNTADGLR
jgi:hypothetical protein